MKDSAQVAVRCGAARNKSSVGETRPRSTDAVSRLFNPAVVAVIGATEREGSVGRALMENLRSFTGTVYPINQTRSRVLHRRAYRAVGLVPETPDVAIIAVPAPAVSSVVEECIEAGIPAAVIITAGFSEAGRDGEDLQQKLIAVAKGRIRLLGPNCLGILLPHIGLNASFGVGHAHPGNIAFLSQSGALCAAVLDWSVHDHVGFSAFVSMGAMADLGWADLIDHFGKDERTTSIICYMESLGDARAFLAAAERVAVSKPIVVLKAGSTQEGARAAHSHTGAMTGSNEVVSAAFERSGILRVRTIDELFNVAEILGKQPAPAGPRLAILTNAGGPAALAADALVSGGGLLADFAEETKAELNRALPANAGKSNPVDLLGTASAVDYEKTAAKLLSDSETDGLLAILTPQAMTKPAEVAISLAQLAAESGKPVLASWMGEGSVRAGRQILNAESIPTFDYPDAAGRAFALLSRQKKLVVLLQERMLAPAEATNDGKTLVAKSIDAARGEGRVLLSELEANKVLKAYGVPVLCTISAIDEEQAVCTAQRLGFPVALKLWSNQISHKASAGGVRLQLRDEEQVRRAFGSIREAAIRNGGGAAFLGVVVQPMASAAIAELIVGSSDDPQVGPVILFGAGGSLAEGLEDRALALPPIRAADAMHVIESTRIGRALMKHPAARPRIAELQSLLLAFGRIVTDHPAIAEIEANPIAVTANGCFALDARVALCSPA
jgi:acetyltransferase